MSPKSHNRRRDGSIHLKRGPIPYRYIKAHQQMPNDLPSLADVLQNDPSVVIEPEAISEVEDISSFGIDVPELSDILANKPAKLYRPIFPPGPRDMTNQSRNLKFMVIPDYTEHHFRDHVAKKPDGSMGQKVRTVKIPLYTLAPRGRTYALGKKRGGPGTPRDVVANA